jgi:putative transposase
MHLIGPFRCSAICSWLDQRQRGPRWHYQRVNVSHVCIGASVGLEEIDNGIWDVYFGPLKLGRLLERYLRSEDAYGRLTRRR